MEKLPRGGESPVLDSSLDSIITLISAASSSETERVSAINLHGAFDELVANGQHPELTEHLNEEALIPEFFNALDVLIDQGYVELTHKGYELTELGQQRAASP